MLGLMQEEQMGNPGTLKSWLSLILAVCILSGAATLKAATQPDRQVAITIDDLPAANAHFMDAATITDLTSRLVGTLRDQKIPAVGFVNERKLYISGEKSTNE